MTSHPEPAADEGVLDPWVTEWMAANPELATPMTDLPPELLELARGPVGFPPTREIATITDDDVEGVPIRIYQGEGAPTGLVVYFHGGGYCFGSIGLMDNVAARARARLGCDRRLGRIPARAGRPVPGGARRLRAGHPLGVRQRRTARRVAAVGRGRG